MTQPIDCSPTSELFEELLLCARYGEDEDLTKYLALLSPEQCSIVLQQHDAHGNTMLHLCAANGHLPVVNLLLSKESGALNEQNEGGNTPLHWACLNGHLETVKHLVGAGADVKLKNKGGRMPIDEAENQGRESLVLWLLALDMKREQEAGLDQQDSVNEADPTDVNVSLSAGVATEEGTEQGTAAKDSEVNSDDMVKNMDVMNMLD